MFRVDAACRPWMLAALCLAAACASATAASSTVYRCTGANGQVTLSDRRCPDDDAQAKAKVDATKGTAPKAEPAAKDSPQKADAAKATASQASAAIPKACGQARDKLDERRKQKGLSVAERKALRELEDETRRTCGA